MYLHSIIIKILDKKNRIYEKEKFFFLNEKAINKYQYQRIICALSGFNDFFEIRK